ncbi:MAG: histidine kinase dimerization/phospho-acceptor domain-containing protein [Erythrobacter sp.]
MLLDDRLATVLRISTASDAGRRTQLRQLLDLLGSRAEPRNPDEGVREQSLIAAAWLRMDALAEAIPAPDRAAIIREPGWRFRNPELAQYLADHEPEVASAALLRAELDADEWMKLIPQLPIRARGFLRMRRDLPLDAEALLDRLGVHDRGLPAPPERAGGALPGAGAFADPPASPAEFLPQAPVIPLRAVPNEPARAPGRESAERSEISALVERIAQFRRERSEAAEELELAPRLPLGEAPEAPRRAALAFGFVTDTSGRIEWASGELAPMVIGTRLLRPAVGLQAPDASRAALARAFARRQPFNRMPMALEGAPAIAGAWLVDGEPRFTAEGHFAGYVGRFRRAAALEGGPDAAAAEEADRIRQLLHELRTPVTAVQGYAEVIQQQLFGPAPHEYRALAAAIAADAAHILAGFDELDRLARLESGVLDIAPGAADLAELVRRMVGQLDGVLAARGAGMALVADRAETLLVALDEEEVEALLWRLLATLAGQCAGDERLAITLTPVLDGPAALAECVCDLPARLAALDDPFASDVRPADHTISTGLFGAGFALRLARAEARRAGGSLALTQSKAVLRVPLITGAETNLQSLVG